MELIYKRASVEDTALLTETRVTVLRTANRLSKDADMEEVRTQSECCCRRALSDGTHAACLVLDGDRFCSPPKKVLYIL